VKNFFSISKTLYQHSDRVRLLEILPTHATTKYTDSPGIGKKVTDVMILEMDGIQEHIKDFLIFSRSSNENVFGFEVFNHWPNIANLNTYGVGDEYPFHVDSNGPGMACDSKLTCILNLSTEPYEGGEFEMFWAGQTILFDQFTPGTVLCFPSFIHHRVGPVTKGKRVTLSTWFIGPMLK